MEMIRMDKEEVRDFKSFLEFVIKDNKEALADIFLTLIDVLPDQIRRDFYSRVYREINKVMEGDKEFRKRIAKAIK